MRMDSARNPADPAQYGHRVLASNLRYKWHAAIYRFLASAPAYLDRVPDDCVNRTVGASSRRLRSDERPLSGTGVRPIHYVPCTSAILSNNRRPVGVFIEASLPALYKSAAMLAVRRQGEDKRSELQVLQTAGDGTVADEVIERYFALRQEVDILPLSSVAITPSNYKFHYAGEVKTGGAAAYVYDITPKKNRPGLLLGKIWMDAGTGDEVMLSGHLMDLPASGGRVDVVRDTKLMDGSALRASPTWLSPYRSSAAPKW